MSEELFNEKYFKEHGHGSSYSDEYWRGSLRILKWFEHRFKIISYEISKAKVVVELGCGLAHSSRVIRAMNPHAFIIAIDISDVASRRAKELYGNDYMLQFIVGDACSIPLRSNSVDAIVSIELYEHLENPLRMLSEVYRVFRGKGTALIATPNARSLSAIIRRDKWIELRDDTHVSLTTPEQLRKNLVKVGFNNINCFTNGFPFLNIIGRILNKLIKAPLGLGAELICIAIKGKSRESFHSDEI